MPKTTLRRMVIDAPVLSTDMRGEVRRVSTVARKGGGKDGDTQAAALIAASARAALASGDPFGSLRTTVRQKAAGWSEVPLPNHDPLAGLIAEPVHLQLVASDGAGTHAVATVGGLIFDAAEVHALPLSRASLDRCVGVHLNWATFSHVARAVRLLPGVSVRKWIRNMCSE